MFSSNDKVAVKTIIYPLIWLTLFNTKLNVIDNLVITTKILFPVLNLLHFWQCKQNQVTEISTNWRWLEEKILTSLY